MRPLRWARNALRWHFRLHAAVVVYGASLALATTVAHAFVYVSFASLMLVVAAAGRRPKRIEAPRPDLYVVPERPRVPWQSAVDRYLADTGPGAAQKFVEDVDEWEATKWPRPWRLAEDTNEGSNSAGQ